MHAGGLLRVAAAGPPRLACRSMLHGLLWGDHGPFDKAEKPPYPPSVGWLSSVMEQQKPFEPELWPPRPCRPWLLRQILRVPISQLPPEPPSYGPKPRPPSTTLVGFWILDRQSPSSGSGSLRFSRAVSPLPWSRPSTCVGAA